MNRSDMLSLLRSPSPQREEKTIERIVCSGGGAKGIVYPGSHRALEETGVLKTVRQIAGTSAGSMTAAFMAVGMASSFLRKIMSTTSLKSLLGDSVGSLFGHHAPGICFITKDGLPLELFIRQHLIEAVKISLHKIERIDEITLSDRDLRSVMMKLEGSNPQLTFGDLGVLSDRFPQQFKELTVPAARFPDGILQIFNRELTPDVEIALACRASSSIPALLKPVEIEVDGKKQLFVDGGVFDNLPTDYFDCHHQLFSKNLKPHQTLVLAFGDHADEHQNMVFKALYASRWDEVIQEEILEKIVEMAIRQAKHFFSSVVELNAFENQAQLIIHAIQSILEQRVRQEKMSIEEARNFMRAVKKSFESLSTDYHHHSVLTDEYTFENHAHEISQLIKKNMRPVLFDVGIMSQLKFHIVLETLGDLDLHYSYTNQNEAMFQKIRSDYPLRTVELRVGDLSTFDFDEATKHARILDAFGYLDTINFITNHHLHDEEQFKEDLFYLDLMHNFEYIFQAILRGAGKNVLQNEFNQELASLRQQLILLGKSEAVICRQLYYFVKSIAEKSLDSVEAFALSRAVEFHNQIIDADELFKEVYEEGFKYSGFLSTAHITGERFFSSSALHASLKNKHMMTLFQNKLTHHEASRADRVFCALNKIERFQRDFEDSKDGLDPSLDNYMDAAKSTHSDSASSS